MTQPRGTVTASWVSARGTWGDAVSGGLSGARSSPGGVGAEVQPLADPRAAPGAKRDVCDPHREAQAELDLVPWPPCPAPTTWVPGAQVSSLMVLGGISQPSRAWLHGPQPPRPAPCGLSCCPRRPSYFPPGRTGPGGSAPPWLATPAPHQAVPGPASPSSSHVLRDILFTPTAPSDGSSSRQPSWVPLLCPGPCTLSGCWGGGRAAPPPAPTAVPSRPGVGRCGGYGNLRRGVGGGLTCELGPQS